MFKNLILPVLLLLSFASNLQAQYTQVGQGAFTGVTFGPMTTVNASPYFNRHAYIYPSASIGNLIHGDTISSIEFMRWSFDSLVGDANFKIYIKNAVKADFGSGSINWMSEARDSGMTLVYNDNPRQVMGDKAGFVRFDFNEAAYYVFDTTGGAVNLQVLVEYYQTTNQPNGIDWQYESGNTVPSFISVNETKFIFGDSTNWMDSIANGSNRNKPTIRFNHPRYDQDLEIRNIYALGTVPLLMDRADTIKAIIQNIGKSTVYNHKAYLTVSGVNSFSDSVVIDSLRPYEQSMLYFSTYIPVQQGTETLKIELAADDESSNNSNSKDRNVNYNVYSHFDPFIGSSGGIGFSGSTGDFVAKFYVNGSSWINQVKVDFAVSNLDFQIGIWEDDGPGGNPGTNIFTSNSLLTVAGTYILPVLPRVQVSGGYYVGIRQTSTTNVAFSYQPEVPVRPHAFYFAEPMGDSIWVPFSPGFDFNFNIQPRLQVANDLAITDIRIPQDGDTILYHSNDSITPTAEVTNFGFLNQNNITVTAEVYNSFNQLHYSSSKVISIVAGNNTLLEFDKLSLYALGEFRIEVKVNLNLDSVKDNNMLTAKFYIGKEHDVSPVLVFEPVDLDSFEVNVQGMLPQVRVINLGIRWQTDFPVTIRIKRNGEIVENQTKTITLAPFFSTIITFDSIFVKEMGWHDFEVYTALYRDSFLINDTIKGRVFGTISNDVLPLEILNPPKNNVKQINTSFQPFVSVRNQGMKSQDSVLVSVRIYDKSGVLAYSDSLFKSITMLSTVQAIFRNFQTGSVPTVYKIVTETRIANDQLLHNDTLSKWFYVGYDKDLVLQRIDDPLHESTRTVDTTPVNIRFTVLNNGAEMIEDATALLEMYDEEEQLLLSDIISIENLTSGQSVQLSATQKWVFDQSGYFKIRLINTWDDEHIHSSNDTLHSLFLVRYQNNLTINKHIMPVDKDTVDLHTVVYPGIELYNTGLDTLYDVSVNLELLNAFNNVVYRDTLYEEILLPGEKKEVYGKYPHEAEEIGKYSFRSSNSLIDDKSQDNLLETEFHVALRYDVAADSASLPKPGQALEIKRNYKPAVAVSNKGLRGIDSGFMAHCMIYVDGLMIYHDSLSVLLLPGESTLLHFDSSLRYNEITEAKAVFKVYYHLDREFTNDSLLISFRFDDRSSVENLKTSSWEVYPNPFSSYIHINAKTAIRRLVLYSELGVLLYVEEDIRPGQHKIEQKLPAGIYFLHIVEGDGKYQTRRLIKLD